MNRPCFSLGVLLTSLAVCLFAVGSANSQTGDGYSPPCLSCPYAGHSFGFPVVAVHSDRPSSNVIAELPATEIIEPPSADESSVNSDADYDLDYDAADYDYSDYDYSDYDYSDYDYSDYDYDDSDYDVDADDAGQPEASDVAAEDEADVVDSAYDDYDDDYNYDYDYDYSNYEEDDADTDAERDAELNADDSDEEVAESHDAEYDNYDYDYSEYDYSDYDYSEYEDAEAETEVDMDADEAASEYSDADYGYDYSEYDDYDYSEYEDAEAETEVDMDADEAASEHSDADYDDYDEYDYDYSEYDDYDYDYDYEDSYAAENEDTAATVVEDPSSDSATAESNAYDEFDNYDYEDYFAEVYSAEDAAVEAQESAVIESAPEADAPVVQEDVDAFDFFEDDTEAPTVDQDLFDEADLDENYDGYEWEYGLIDLIEEAQADDATTPSIDPIELDAEVAAELEADVAEDAGADEADASLYDLRTTYDESYDGVMAPTAAPPTAEIRDFGTTDHCFGGYAEPYQSEYRCDLADQYQSFYHDGSDPSATETEAVDEAVDEADLSEVHSALPMVVEPYVAFIIDRVSGTWQQFSLDAIVAKAAKELAEEVAKLPEALSSVEDPSVETSITDYVDCHIDAGNHEWNGCELDCVAPWEPSQPIGLGVTIQDDAACEPADSDAEQLDTASLEATKESIRDLRSRMNATRRSPPLR